MTTTAMTAAGILVFSGTTKAQLIDADTTPTGGVEVFGDITINQAGTHTDITQLQNVGLINWESFNHGRDATTEFHQPNASSWTFNRVTGKVDGARTIIEGSITANGNIGILDDNGILITETGSLDAAGVLLTTGGIENFAAAAATGIFEIINLDDNSVENQGTITVAEAGLAAFVAPTITNSGTINAKMGDVVLASGKTVTLDLFGDGLVEVAVSGELEEGLIKNTGRINAQGGNVQISAAVAKEAVDNVINMAGVTTVSSATVKGGKIILSGGNSGRVNVTGTLQASGGAGQDAGDIKVTGENIRVKKAGRLRANAGDENVAGNIELLATNMLDLRGQLRARGKEGSGFIETSAPTTSFGAKASILATREWLLDPTDLEVNAGDVLEGLIEAQLGTGNMTLQTPTGGTDQGNIDINTVIDWAADNTFKVIADGSVNVNSSGGINAAGVGGFTAMAGDDIEINGDITTQGGDVTLVAGLDANQDDINVDADITTNGGNFVAMTADDLRIRAVVNTGGGDVVLTTLDNANVSEISITAVGSVNTAGGNVNLNSDDIRISTVDNGTQRIDADAGDVTINRVSEGTIGLGDAAGDTRITQGEIAAITAMNLVIGDALATRIGVDAVDAATNIAGLVQLNALGTNGDITFDGTNVFTALVAEASDDVHVRDGSSITTTMGGVSLTANNTVSDGVTVLEVDGIIDTIAAGANGDIDLAATGYFAEIDVTGKVLTDGGAFTVTSNHGFDIDSGAMVMLGDGGAFIDAPLVQLGDDIVTTGAITGTASTVKVENDNAQIQDGVDVAVNNATVTVVAGTYAESVNVNKAGLQLLGANAGIKGNDSGRGPESLVTPTSPGFFITANNVVLDGFAVDGGDEGVLVDGADSVTVKNNVIINTTENGIKVVSSDDGFIQGNKVSDAGHNGIAVIDSNNAIINMMNVVNGTFSAGVSLNRTTNSLVNGNKVSHVGGSGVWINAADGSTISDNEIDTTALNASRSTGSGVHVRNTDNVDVLGNEIANAGIDGIHVESSDTVKIDGNDIDVATNGVRVVSGSGITASNNEIDDAVVAGIHVSNVDNAQINSNFVNDHGATTFTDYGILVAGGNSVDVDDNKIEETNIAGIAANNTTFIDIDDNLVKDGTDGIVVSGGFNADVRRNTVQDMNDDGIDTNNHNNIDLEGNIINRVNGHGIEVENSNFANVSFNQIHDANFDGVNVVGGFAADIFENHIGRAGFDGIDVTSNAFVDIYNNEIYDAGDNGIEVEGGFAADIFDNHIGRSGDDGIDVDGNAFVMIQENYIHGSGLNSRDGNGIEVSNSFEAVITDNEIEFTRDDGIEVDGSDFVNIRRNDITGAGGDGIDVDDSYAADIVNNEIVGTFGNGIGLRNSDNVRINRNTIHVVAENGIEVDGGRNIRIRNNHVGFVGNDGINVDENGRVRITGNEIHDVDDEGIQVTNAYSRRGIAVRVIDNNVQFTGDKGVKIEGFSSALIEENRVRDTGGDGIQVEEGGFAEIFDNRLRRNDGNGIAGYDVETTDIRRNFIRRSSKDGIILDGFGAAEIVNNDIARIGDDGIEVRNGTALTITRNDINRAGFVNRRNAFDADGIHVENINGSTGERFNVRIINNNITNSDDDGIEALNVNRILAARNIVDESGDDGIRIVNGLRSPIRVPNVVLFDPRPNLAVVRRNEVSNSGTQAQGGDGIEVSGFGRIRVRANDISNSVENGLNISGGFNGDVTVSENILTDNEVSANFESGVIDLTETGNMFTGGTTGLRFAPFDRNGKFSNVELQAFALEEFLEGSDFASLELVDNTIGAQIFDGQDNFAVLENGAFFAPGTPTLLDATDSTFLNTPLGNIGPQLFYTAEQISFLDSQFVDFTENGNTGLFFFPQFVDIDQEDIFQFFSNGGGDLGGFALTILGLPTIPGTSTSTAEFNPASLNNITPAAGGEPTAEELNNLETAAGGEEGAGNNATCWGDALSAAGAGGPVNFSYGDGAEGLLNGEASCGS